MEEESIVVHLTLPILIEEVRSEKVLRARKDPRERDVPRFLRGTGDASRCIFQSLRWWRMAPEKPRLVSSPVADNYLKGGGGERPKKSRGERNGTKRGERRNESVAVGSEPRGEGRPEGKTRSFLTGSEEPEGATEGRGEDRFESV